MRLLHIMASRALGGAETYAVDMILALHRAGVDQCVVTPADAPRTAELAAAGVRLATAPLARRLAFRQRAAVARLIAAERPELIHCWMRRAASLLPAGRPAPAVGWFGGYYDPAHFARCDALIGVTPGIVAHMVAKGIAADRAIYVPTFPAIVPAPPIDRAVLDTPPAARVVLALSRLHPKKGLDTLLDAMAALGADYHLWLAGEGALLGALEAQARRLGLGARVHFLGWRTDRAALLGAADVCVLPSRYEPFGTVILEAWAADVPLVAAASAGPAATVADGQTGLLVPIDDAPALAAALRRAAEDEGLRARLVAGGRAAYLRDYTQESVTAQMRAAYRRILAQVHPIGRPADRT
ncbi:MAG: glycosyltransferase [Proteobacteria bacterium]|nr:glycosyltransferase [Pseudomonadota bacterium]